MSKRQQYGKEHRLAKVIVLLGILVLLYLDGVLTTLTGMSVVLWLFGINTVQYIIEIVKKHRHNVNWW